jgi:hypothetical protein
VKFPVLVSYAYARKSPVAFATLAQHPHVELLLDSGAFTAKNTGETIGLAEYCRFLDTWGESIFRYLALDVVGDPEATDRNLQEMLRKGYKPVPVHVLGDDQRRMDELFEYSDYVALAGLRRPHKGGAPKEYVAAKMKWAAGRDVHWLGYVRESMIGAFRPYSCDSSSWLQASIFGVMRLYMGAGKWNTYSHDDHGKLLRDAKAFRMISQMGFTSKQVADPNCWRRARSLGYSYLESLAAAATVDSWVRYVIDVRLRYGTRIFLATNLTAPDVAHLLWAVERNAGRLDVEVCG